MGLLTLIRILLATRIPLGDDESFYWLWSNHLAPCYFDHPGMVAWLVYLGRMLLGETSLAVRLPTILASAGAILTAFYLGRTLFGERAGYLAAALVAVPPLFALGGFLVASDGPLALLWLLTMLFTAKAAISEKRGWHYAAGVSAGLALCTKFTGVLLFPSILLFLLTCKSTRRDLLRKEPWLAALLALAVFSPVLYWNATNGWASFVFNAAGRHEGAHLQIVWLGQLLAVEMLFLSPLVLVSFAAALWRLFRLKGSNPRFRLLFWFSVPTLTVFWGASFVARILPHWPAMGYLGLALATGALWNGAGGRKAKPSWIAATLGVAAVMSVLVHIQPMHQVIPLGPKEDNTNHLFGWDQVTEAVERELARMKTRSERLFVFTDRYQLAAQLSWNLKDPNIARSINPVRDQFDYWNTPEELIGSSGIFVWEESWGKKQEALDAFRKVEEIETIPVYRQGKRIRTFHILRCIHLETIPTEP